jgi:hypothetical protein
MKAVEINSLLKPKFSPSPANLKAVATLLVIEPEYSMHLRSIEEGRISEGVAEFRFRNRLFRSGQTLRKTTSLKPNLGYPTYRV